VDAAPRLFFVVDVDRPHELHVCWIATYVGVVRQARKGLDDASHVGCLFKGQSLSHHLA
jgi:hypothetical protein